MLRVIIGMFFISSCSMGVMKSGGKGVYTYDSQREYSLDELKILAPAVITTSRRDPPVGNLNKLFGKGQAPLKKVGIIIFESQIQPTRGGLAGHDFIYLSEQGKQLLTENLLSIWEQVFISLSTDVEFVSTQKMIKSKSFHKFGSDVEDYVKTKRTSLAPDDIFFLEKGRKTTTATILNPRGMRDLSLIFVPATELMMGPKWSEANKQFVNEISKELGLDATLLVMNDFSWTAARTDKSSGENIPEEIKLGLSASTLLSLSQYRNRAAKIGEKHPPSVNLCLRAYESKLKLPAKISLALNEQTFDSIEMELLAPIFKTYRDQSIMMISQILKDLRNTH